MAATANSIFPRGQLPIRRRRPDHPNRSWSRSVPTSARTPTKRDQKPCIPGRFLLGSGQRVHGREDSGAVQNGYPRQCLDKRGCLVSLAWEYEQPKTPELPPDQRRPEVRAGDGRPVVAVGRFTRGGKHGHFLSTTASTEPTRSPGSRISACPGSSDFVHFGSAGDFIRRLPPPTQFSGLFWATIQGWAALDQCPSNLERHAGTGNCFCAPIRRTVSACRLHAAPTRGRNVRHLYGPTGAFSFRVTFAATAMPGRIRDRPRGRSLFRDCDAGTTGSVTTRGTPYCGF